jgi:hypothetical protein
MATLGVAPPLSFTFEGNLGVILWEAKDCHGHVTRELQASLK